MVSPELKNYSLYFGSLVMDVIHIILYTIAVVAIIGVVLFLGAWVVGHRKVKMNTWEDFEKEARLVEKTTIEQEPEVVHLIQDAIGIFADAFSVGNNSDTSDATLAKMSLLSHNFGTLKCSVDIALRGYYVQSLNLLRIVYENWIAFHFLEKSPDKAHLWLRHSKKELPPKHAAMLKELDANFNPLKGQMKKWYSTLCSFAHTDPVNLLPQISTDNIPNETSIHFGSTYKNDLFKGSAYAICLWAGVMLSTISTWVPKTNQWHNGMTKIEERIIQFIDQENKAFKSGTT